jgi:glycosyltransferase involved in cell wall biosynthesis
MAMRVHFVGNVCNNHYVLAKFLRRIGVDAHLYYDPKEDIQNQPQAEDPEMSNLPNWLHPISSQRSRFQSPHHVTDALLMELGACDILHAHDLGVIWAAKTGRPFVWHPYGGDLFHLPFYFDKSILGQRWGISLPDPRKLLLPLAMRRAISRASAIVLGWHNRLWVPGLKLIRRLRKEQSIVRLHLGLNTDRFSFQHEAARRALRLQYLPHVSPEKLIIFHPTRQAFSSAYNTKKGNDLLYRALARLKKEGGDFLLVVVKKDEPEEIIARELMKELSIDDSVMWIPKMPRFELIRWYGIADLTADHFFAGALGSISLESMSCGTPVMTFVQTKPDGEIFLDPMEMFPELPPVINVSSEEEIYHALTLYSSRRDELTGLGKRGRAWVEGYASGEVVARRFSEVYESVLSK